MSAPVVLPIVLKRRVTVVNKLGLHARAAAKLVKLTAGFNSVIKLSVLEKTVDAKSIMGVMMLAAAQGSELTLVVRGDDAHQAAAAVCQMFADCFGEGE